MPANGGKSLAISAMCQPLAERDDRVEHHRAETESDALTMLKRDGRLASANRVPMRYVQ